MWIKQFGDYVFLKWQCTRELKTVGADRPDHRGEGGSTAPLLRRHQKTEKKNFRKSVKMEIIFFVK